MKTVAVLFARADSIYKTLPGCDVWDIERNAKNFPGGMPIVAHPPCRAWGCLKHFAKPAAGEKELALWSVDQVRKWGGVLEHPAASTLWREAKLPRPGIFDSFGGWTLAAPQFWWGHRAEKATRFYICGVTPKQIPDIPFVLGDAPFLISHGARTSRHKKAGYYVRPEVKRWEREATPIKLAEWLVEMVRCTSPPARQVIDGAMSN